MRFDYHRCALNALRMFAAGVVIVLMGCGTTGSNFDASSMDLLVPGQTTLTQASALFKVDPTDVYRQSNGAAMARWSYRASFVPDAVYFTREVWLSFDSNGHFERIVKSVNVPQAWQAPHTRQSAPAQPFQAVPAGSAQATPVQL